MKKKNAISLHTHIEYSFLSIKLKLSVYWIVIILFLDMKP